jgi:hypothetical protein
MFQIKESSPLLELGFLIFFITVNSEFYIKNRKSVMI